MFWNYASWDCSIIFNKIFKVRADFDYEVEKNEDTIQKYARFVARACKEENLLPLTPQGVAAIVEFGEKYIADKNKLSIRFGPIMGILKEADYWAHRENAENVSAKHVVKAFNEHRFRYNLYEEKIHESYVDNTIMIDVEGDVVGQVNALSVFQIFTRSKLTCLGEYCVCNAIITKIA